MLNPAEYGPVWPRRRDWRIGCVGAGFVMRDCHLAAYRPAGFNPVAIAARRVEQAREVAVHHGIPKVHESVDDLLRDESIEILDIAVPPAAQPDLIRRAVECGRGRLKGILAQKPLAMSVATASDLVECCEAAGITLAVNQNMRFDQSVRGAKALIDRGELGEIVFASIDMRAIPHWMPWARELPSLSTFVMSIHHLDTFRYWLGTPDRVFASSRPDPRTTFPHRDGINLTILEWDDGPRASAWDDVWAGPIREGAAGEPRITWRIEGTRGLAEGTIGWPGYPARVPSTLHVSTVDGRTWKSSWNDVWFPDAFAGTMASLLVAIESGSAPAISGRDNLATLAVCEAVFASGTGDPNAPGRVVRISPSL
jgi:predicted dehydrogenase